jgi:hypothetical protein
LAFLGQQLVPDTFAALTPLPLQQLFPDTFAASLQQLVPATFAA